MLEREPGGGGQLFVRRLAAQLGLELARDAEHLHPPLVDVRRDADRGRLARDGPLARLTDPPRRVRGELVALAPVELLDCAVEADRALLDQVQQRHGGTLVALRDRDHEAKVRVDHPLLGGGVAALDVLRERDLVGGSEQLVAAGPVHEQGQRVARTKTGAGDVGLRGRTDLDFPRVELGS